MKINCDIGERGCDNATDLAAGTFDGTGNLDIGFGTSEHDPLDVMAYMARLLDEQNIPGTN